MNFIDDDSDDFLDEVLMQYKTKNNTNLAAKK